MKENTRNPKTGGPKYIKAPGGFGCGNTRTAQYKDCTVLDYIRKNQNICKVKAVTLPGGYVYRGKTVERA